MSLMVKPVVTDVNAFRPGTEVKITDGGNYDGKLGVVIKSDKSSEQICLDIDDVPYPLWCLKSDVEPTGNFHNSDVINRHIWHEIYRETYNI